MVFYQFSILGSGFVIGEGKFKSIAQAEKTAQDLAFRLNRRIEVKEIPSLTSTVPQIPYCPDFYESTVVIIAAAILSVLMAGGFFFLINSEAGVNVTEVNFVE